MTKTHKRDSKTATTSFLIAEFGNVVEIVFKKNIYFMFLNRFKVSILKIIF